ncbi:hypothetical protein TNCV_3841581 [Trichonephila clavipes]|nr:hypothetical protein TNCV_3841581 [Trichonephila clavipes]
MKSGRFQRDSRFSLGSDNNRARVWRFSGECLNLAFAVQRHTTPTTDVMVQGAIAYVTWSPTLSNYDTMASQRSTLNSHRALSPLVRLVEEKERWEAVDQLQLNLAEGEPLLPQLNISLGKNKEPPKGSSKNLVPDL